MVIVRLNNWNEFLVELHAQPPTDRIVRLTFSIRYDGRNVPYLTMVGGYFDNPNIVEFVDYLGLQPQDAKSDRAREIQALFEKRKQHLEGQGFVVKSGRYRVPPASSH